MASVIASPRTRTKAYIPTEAEIAAACEQIHARRQGVESANRTLLEIALEELEDEPVTRRPRRPENLLKIDLEKLAARVEAARLAALATNLACRQPGATGPMWDAHTMAFNRWEKLLDKFNRAVDEQSHASKTLNYFWMNRGGYRNSKPTVAVPASGPREMSKADIANVGLVIVQDLERYSIVEEAEPLPAPKTHRDVRSFRSKRK